MGLEVIIPSVQCCKKCQVLKPVEEFRATKTGFRMTCKKCESLQCMEYQKKHSEKIRAYTKEYNAKYRLLNKDKIFQMQQQYRQKNKARLTEQKKEYYEKHKESILPKRRDNTLEYYHKNKERLNQRAIQRRRDDPILRLHNTMGVHLYKVLRMAKNGKKWESLVGYSIDDLKRHLEKLFKPGMTWENYGLHGWHVDHKIPVSVFNYSKAEDIDFKRCWALENLQPMWAKENIRKRAKLTKPFQPSLKLGVI